MDATQRLTLERGFAGTSVDAVIAEAEVTKGAFFHHFPSKNDLGRALLRRYAAADSETLQTLIAAADDETDDPAGQVVAFVRLFADAAEEFARTQSGCLFASFIYERELDDGRNQIIADGIREWRERLLAKLEAAAAAHPPALPVDLPSLADQVVATFEGGFILARAMNDPAHLRAQLTHLRNYLELLFPAPARPLT
jgi:TetR/AcrR family transcriptional regulator, transcriptional repressor for nem operon